QRLEVPAQQQLSREAVAAAAGLRSYRTRIGVMETEVAHEHVRDPAAERMAIARRSRRSSRAARQVGDEEMSDDVRWIRSYVFEEGAGPSERCASTKRPARKRSANTLAGPICRSTRSSRSSIQSWSGATLSRRPP